MQLVSVFSLCVHMLVLLLLFLSECQNLQVGDTKTEFIKGYIT